MHRSVCAGRAVGYITACHALCAPNDGPFQGICVKQFCMLGALSAHAPYGHAKPLNGGFMIARARGPQT
eukprot:6214654-Pleurochrysis_carterae.AAC.1